MMRALVDALGPVTTTRTLFEETVVLAGDLYESNSNLSFIP
jgi:hypothetical protein